MISKFQISKDILNCFKCDQYSHNLFALPCHHFVCLNCVNSQTVKIFYHCKKWKLFFNHEINSPVSFRLSRKLHAKFIQYQYDSKLDTLELFYLSSNEINFGLLIENFKCQNCLEISSKIFIDNFGNFKCYKCFQLTDININEKIIKMNLAYSQLVNCIFETIKEILNRKVENLFSEVEILFYRTDTTRDQAISSISNENFINNFNLDEKKIILITKKTINMYRNNLIKEVESKKLDALKYLQNDYQKFKFIKCKTSFLSIQIAGYFKNIVPIAKRVKFIHFYPRFSTFKHSIHSEKNLTNWTPFNKIIDFFSPIYLTQFYCIILKSINREYNYETVIQSRINNQNFSQHQFKKDYKIEYFRIDYNLNRIGFLFEIKYDLEYALKIYDLYGSRLMCSRNFDSYIDNFLFDGKIILTWSSNCSSCLNAFNENLQKLEEEIKLDEEVNDLFYYLADCDEKFLYLNNQSQIGKVCKKTGKLVCIFSLNESENFLDEKTLRPLHIASEYLNIKIYQEFMVITTYSKIFVVDKQSFKLLSENIIFLIKNNDWSIPNKIYFTKDGYLALFDKNNITFI